MRQIRCHGVRNMSRNEKHPKPVPNPACVSQEAVSNTQASDTVLKRKEQQESLSLHRAEFLGCHVQGSQVLQPHQVAVSRRESRVQTAREHDATAALSTAGFWSPALAPGKQTSQGVPYPCSRAVSAEAEEPSVVHRHLLFLSLSLHSKGPSLSSPQAVVNLLLARRRI